MMTYTHRNSRFFDTALSSKKDLFARGGRRNDAHYLISTGESSHIFTRGEGEAQKKKALRYTTTMFKSSLVLTAFLLSVLTRESVSLTDNDDAPYVLRWASSGGGWRAMAANCGYTSSFAATGLITSEDSKFTAISTNSGGSW
jgi:hypothetical protein